MIKIYCDICGKEPDDNDFMFEATKIESMISLAGGDLSPQKKTTKQLIQFCKGCFYKHISKLLKNGKE